MLRLHHLPPFSVTSAHYYGKNGGLFFTALQSLAEVEFNHTLFFLLALLTSLSWQQNFKFISEIASLFNLGQFKSLYQDLFGCFIASFLYSHVKDKLT